MYSTVHPVSTCACVVHVQYVLLLTVLIVNMITLHLWDTGSVGIPINNQITYMAEFWDCFRSLDIEYTCTCTLLLMITSVYYQKDVLRLFWQPVLALNLLNVNIDQILPFINVILDHLQVQQTYIHVHVYISRGHQNNLRTCRLAIACLQEK